MHKCGAELRAFALIVGAVCPLRVDLEQPAGLSVPVALRRIRGALRRDMAPAQVPVTSVLPDAILQQISIALIPTAPPVVYIGGVDHAKAALVKSSGNGLALAGAVVIGAMSVS